MQYLGIEWGTRKAAWCALEERGEISGEGVICADEDGLAGLVHRLGANVGACVEMMSGAVWVRDRLAGCGWAVEIADARKAKAIAPLAGKTDRVDARVLAELVRRELVPALWVPSLADRGLRERLRRRSQLVRLRTSADQPQLRPADSVGAAPQSHDAAQAGCARAVGRDGVPEVWRHSIPRASCARTRPPRGRSRTGAETGP